MTDSVSLSIAPQTRLHLFGLRTRFSCGIALPLLALLLLAQYAMHSDLDMLAMEKALLWSLRSHAGLLLRELAQTVSALVTVISVFILGWLLYRRFWRIALFWLISVSGAAILASLLKNLVQRHRPGLWTTVASHATYSFPSGHATQSMAIALALVILLRSSKRLRTICTVCIASVLLVAFCRMYLGHHFPTDILAGWLLALAWIAALVLAFDQRYTDFRASVPASEQNPVPDFVAKFTFKNIGKLLFSK